MASTKNNPVTMTQDQFLYKLLDAFYSTTQGQFNNILGNQYGAKEKWMAFQRVGNDLEKVGVANVVKIIDASGDVATMPVAEGVVTTKDYTVKFEPQSQAEYEAYLMRLDLNAVTIQHLMAEAEIVKNDNNVPPNIRRHYALLYTHLEEAWLRLRDVETNRS